MRLCLAPLAGFTDAPFRRLCAEGGAEVVYTEMVSAAGMAHGSSPTRHLLETMEGEGKTACQIFGANERDVALATREIEGVAERFCELNLNAGCPMTKVTREGAGAKLIGDPKLVYRILKAMAENTALPISLKTRLGPHPKEVRIFELLDAAEQAGASKLIVHARYTSQMHGGKTDLETLSEVVKRARIEVVGNGSVVDDRTAKEMASTGVSSIMIGRAALARPRIFRELAGNEVGTGDGEGALAVCRRHLGYVLEFRRQLVERFPGDHVPSADGYASVKMHTHLFRYFNGRPGAAALRAKLNQVRTIADIETVFGEIGQAEAGATMV